MPPASLLAVEGLLGPVALDDDEPDVLDPLEGGVPPAAGEALPAPADGAAAVGGTGVDDAGRRRRGTRGIAWEWTTPQDVVAARTVPAAAASVKVHAGAHDAGRCPGTRPSRRRRRWPTRCRRRPRWDPARRHARGDRPDRVARPHDHGAGVPAGGVRLARVPERGRAPTVQDEAATADRVVRRRRTRVRLMPTWCPNACSVSRPESNICLHPPEPWC